MTVIARWHTSIAARAAPTLGAVWQSLRRTGDRRCDWGNPWWHCHSPSVTTGLVNRRKQALTQ